MECQPGGQYVRWSFVFVRFVSLRNHCLLIIEGGACPFLFALVLCMNHDAISNHQIIKAEAHSYEAQ